jgi:hypothetical protein
MDLRSKDAIETSKQDNIIMNNILIAEFMGLDTEVFNSGLLNYNHNNVWYEEHELSYNVSWDWLMPVIHKCFDVAEDGQMSDIMHHLQIAEMGDTYDAVVEFIKDYNQNN